MRLTRAISVVLSLIFAVMTSHAQEQPAPTASRSAASESGNMRSNYGKAPLMFEENQGQTNPEVRFLSHGSGYSVFLTAGGMVLALRPSETDSVTGAPTATVPSHDASRVSPIRRLEKAFMERESTALTIDLVGAAAAPVSVGEEALSTKVNYFIGRDPSKWRRNVPTYGKIRYRRVYPGIDLVYYGNDHRVEYDFDLAPGADATQIQFDVKGADALTVDSAGNLVLTKGSSVLRFQAPIVYQEHNGKRAPVAGTYVLRDATHVGFEVGAYDTTKPLVIDPVLVYSTFLGGSNEDFSNGIAVDSMGEAYEIGLTNSPDFPSASIALRNTRRFRMFLTKFDPTGSTLLFADYFGGTSGGDEASGVALDSSGNAYITGDATSSDFPVVNAYQSALAGSQDAFLVKFSADGSSLMYSTYLGGSALTYIGGSTSQFGTSVSVDPAGEAVIAGVTMATDFPTANAYQSSVSADQFGDWGVYGFVTKFAANGASLVYSTYLSGSTLDTSPPCIGCFPDSEILGVVTDASGNAYVTGYTTATDFPVTSGAFTTTYPGSYSAVGVVSKFTAPGAIAYSTYLSGVASSTLDAIAVDASGSAYVTGSDSAGDNFPVVTTSICDPAVSACNGAIIAKLDPTGSSLIYSTFLGTSNNMSGQAIQVDSSGDAFIVGSDVQFDLANPIEQYAGGDGDVVVAEIDPSASTLLMATFLGGQGWEAASGLALDSNGAVYVTGETQSLDFPVTQSAFQTMFGGQTDTFITKIDPTTSAPAAAMGPFSLQFASQNIGSTSAPQTTVLRNMGSAALTISNKTVGPDFAETDNCGLNVPAASLCTFTVTFTPTASGSLTEALTITDNAQGSPHVVSLTGTGAGSPSSFNASPSQLSFPSSLVGTTTAAQNVTVTNTSDARLSIRRVQATGDFSVGSNKCRLVAPGGTCTVQVRFTPTTAGIRSGRLRLLDPVGRSKRMVALTGLGIDSVTSTTSALLP
jgi:hypothetical protein